MNWSEFDLIQWIISQATSDASVLLGMGDDAALVAPSVGSELVVATDTCVSGTHFPSNICPQWLGHKTLAVTLSDMAAMGAKPRWALLSLTLSELDPAWLTHFFGGFFKLANRYNISLVGGDTTRGQEHNIAVTVLGEVPQGQALKRKGAQVGDGIFVIGELGGAGLAYQLWRDGQLSGHQHQEILEQIWHCPEPKLIEGERLRGNASAAIDVSDGLIVDLQHILTASGVGAELNAADLPLFPPLAHVSEDEAWSLACCGGEDYALCLTSQLTQKQLNDLGIECTKIGQVIPGQGLSVYDPAGKLLKLRGKGYEHFS